MKLSVVIPVYNEFKTLRLVMEAVRGSEIENLQLIIVDDGSCDGTRELLEGPLGELADDIVLHDENMGKGAALKSGVAIALGEYVLFQDADLEYSPSEYGLLLQAMLDFEVNAVYGSRFLGKAYTEVSPLWHRTVNWFLTVSSNLFTGYSLSDMETCYKLFPRAFLQSIEFEESAFGIEPELTAKAALAGLKIREVPITYRRRLFAEGKKIGAVDGVQALYVIAKYGFRSL